jgi:hypothetical protein
MKDDVFWDVTPVAPVRTDVSEERSASIMRVERIGALQCASVASYSLRCSYLDESFIPD